MKSWYVLKVLSLRRWTPFEIQVPDLQAAHHTMPLAMSIYQAACAFEKPNEPLACAIKEMQISFEVCFERECWRLVWRQCGSDTLRQQPQSALRTSLLKATQQVPLHTRMQFLMELMMRAVELGHGKLHVDEA